MPEETLLTVVKRQVFQSNADSETEALINDYIEDGKAFLNRYCAGLDYEKPGRARSLLVEFVRYALAQAKDDFSQNYKSELIALSNAGRAKAYADKQES